MLARIDFPYSLIGTVKQLNLCVGYHTKISLMGPTLFHLSLYSWIEGFKESIGICCDNNAMPTYSP